MIRRKNVRKFDNKFRKYKEFYKKGFIEREKIVEAFEGWLTFVSNADTYKYRKHLTRCFNRNFPINNKDTVVDVKTHENFINKTESSNIQFTAQKTMQLFNKGISIVDIAKLRNIKVSTVWSHLANLIEHNQLSLWKVLPRDKISKILSIIGSKDDKLKEIKERIKDNTITYDEINCVLAFIKSKNRKRNICHLTKWYREIHCLRKCYYEKKQRAECKKKFNFLISSNPHLELTRDEFLELFNNHMNICVLPEPEKKSTISWKRFSQIRSR